MKTMLYILLTVAVILVAWYMIKPGNAADRLSATEFKQKYEQTQGLVIDVRSQNEYESGHIAITDHNFNVMNGEFESKLDSLSKDSTYYLYCRSGNRSGKALQIMKANGFENVYNVGGFSELVNGGFTAE